MATSDASRIPTIRALPASQLAAIGRPAKFGSAIIGDASSIRRKLADLPIPTEYPWDLKTTALVAAGFADVKLFGPLKEFTLSVRDPYVNFGGMLGFFNVVDYVPQTNRAVLYMSDAGGGSFFGIRINSAPAGSRYLLDVVLSGGPVSTLESTPAGTAVPVDNNGHALLVITAAAQGDCGITLIVKGESMYNFHRVVVSRI